MKKIIPPSSTSFQSTPFGKGRNIIVFLILILSYQKTFALELDTFDNLRLFLYSPQMMYNKGVDLYESGDYTKRDFYFDMTKCGKNSDFCSKKFYNKGNSEYKIGEKSNDIAEKEINRGKRANSYNESLKHEFTDETKQNLDFVMQKINELKKEKDGDKKKEEEKKDNIEEKENEKKPDDVKKEEQEKIKQEEKAKKQAKSEEGDKQEELQVVKNQNMGLGGDENSIQKMTTDEAKQLEEYYQSLKNDEKQNQEFFNKKNTDKQQESPFDQGISPFRFFEGNPFFDEPGKNNNQKDW